MTDERLSRLVREAMEAKEQREAADKRYRLLREELVPEFQRRGQAFTTADGIKGWVSEGDNEQWLDIKRILAERPDVCADYVSVKHDVILSVKRLKAE